jgi:hypothetical protein
LSDWDEAIKPTFDILRQNHSNALVAYTYLTLLNTCDAFANNATVQLELDFPLLQSDSEIIWQQQRRPAIRRCRSKVLSSAINAKDFEIITGPNDG